MSNAHDSSSVVPDDLSAARASSSSTNATEQMPDEPPATPPDSATARWVRRLLPFVILAIAGGVTAVMIKSRKPPKRKPPVARGLLVETMAARWERRSVQVNSNGVIQPRREVTVAPEVSGKVVRVHPNLAVGGFLRKGETLLTIDALDYQLAVDSARAQVAQAERRLAEAESAAKVARREWERLGARSGGAAPPALTLHEPQLKAARADLSAARAQVRQAEANRGRTVVRAPFNLRVRQKSVDVGQYVRVGQTLATVYGTDVAEVVVSLPTEELRWLKLPGAGNAAKADADGPAVTVRLKTGSGAYERRGMLARTVGEVDPTGRMSKVVVAIDDPYNRRRKEGDQYQPDFEIGAFVDVELPGRSIAKVMPIPAHALRLGSVVWVADAEQRLRIKPVRVLRRDEKEALVASGLQPSDRLILTDINGAVEGMQLRVQARPAGDKLTAETEAR